jgi:hypothetical protein
MSLFAESHPPCTGTIQKSGSSVTAGHSLSTTHGNAYRHHERQPFPNVCERICRRSLAANSMHPKGCTKPLTGQTIATDDAPTDAPEPDSH